MGDKNYTYMLWFNPNNVNLRYDIFESTIHNNLKSAYIGADVKSIGTDDNSPSVFYKARNLTSVTISEGVEKLYKEAFSNCSNLSSITIPNSVNYIGYDAFYACSSLASVIYKGISYTSKSEIITTLNNSGVTLINDPFYYTALNP